LAEKTTALRLAEDKAAEFEEMADKERRRALQEARARAEADDQRNRLEHEVQILREKLNPQGMA
jgi:vacuolar-type H+-ATPase subunit E/Vma4